MDRTVLLVLFFCLYESSMTTFFFSRKCMFQRPLKLPAESLDVARRRFCPQCILLSFFCEICSTWRHVSTGNIGPTRARYRGSRGNHTLVCQIQKVGTHRAGWFRRQSGHVRKSTGSHEDRHANQVICLDTITFNVGITTQLYFLGDYWILSYERSLHICFAILGDTLLSYAAIFENGIRRKQDKRCTVAVDLKSLEVALN